MSSKGFSEDASAVLFLVPFLVSGAYGIYVWTRSGLSAVLPSTVYLTVTRDPYVFIAGSLAVMLGVVLEVRTSVPAGRSVTAKSVGDTLLSIAVASLVLALIGAWYSNGFVNLTGTATDFIVGRYAVVFPAMLVLLSYLITLRLKFDAFRDPKVLGVIAMLLVPAVVYEVGKRDTAGGLAIALVLAIVGIGLFLRKDRVAATQKQQ